MNLLEFQNLPFEEQLKFVNSNYPNYKTLEQFAKECLGTSGYFISNLFNARGYVARRKQYVLEELVKKGSDIMESVEKETVKEIKGLDELLEVKEDLLNMVKERKEKKSMNLDFSLLDAYSEEEIKQLSVRIPQDLAEAFENLAKKFKRYNKTDLMALCFAEFVAKYGGE